MFKLFSLPVITHFCGVFKCYIVDTYQDQIYLGMYVK